ncbi:MAG: rhodanese-like domain-containing protein [Burkholderiaceae bacterium]|jgi:rhodanese-related sulfurtransferase|nr:rhodanese-like domain-containing protein [Burkholderiaceae bacterium]
MQQAPFALNLLRSLCLTAAVALAPAWAQSNEATEAMADYMAFAEYGGGTIFPEQIPADQYPKTYIIDARDAKQYAASHIPGAVNMEWREVLAQRDSIPKDQMVLIYCNTGSLSAQAGFALRVAGWSNVRILQGGYQEWLTKGGLQANARAGGVAPTE